MKKLFLFILALTVGKHLLSQIPYQTLDSLSAEISKFQLLTAGKTYSDEKKDTYELNFPEENFKVWSNNRLATKAVYKKWGQREVLALTENIDLTKATDLEFTIFNGTVGYLKLIFPAGHLKTQLYENGVLTQTITENYLEFFQTNDKGTAKERKDFLYWTNFKTLAKLCNLLKIEKGLLSENDENVIAGRFDELLNDLTESLELRKKFINDYSGKTPEHPLILLQVKKSYDSYEKKQAMVKSYIDSICTILKYKHNISEVQFISMNPDASRAINWDKETWVIDSKFYGKEPWSKDWLVGPRLLKIKKSTSKITYYEYMYKRFIKNDDEAKTAFNDMVNDMQKKLPYGSCQGFVEGSGWQNVFISNPNLDYFLKIRAKLTSGENRFDKETYIILTVSGDEQDLNCLKKGIWYGGQTLYPVKKN